jgi:hypothetical protein
MFIADDFFFAAKLRRSATLLPDAPKVLLPILLLKELDL